MIDPAQLHYRELDPLATMRLLEKVRDGLREAGERRFLGGAQSFLRMLYHHQPETGFQGVEARLGGPFGDLVGLNIAKVSRQRRGRWGRYVHSHYAYTLPPWRRRGVAKALFRRCEDQWRLQGAGRLKDLIGSWLGVYLHRSLGHTIWGLEKAGHLIIDHPLVVESALDGVPTNVSRQNPQILTPIPYSEGQRLFAMGKGRDACQPPEPPR